MARGVTESAQQSAKQRTKKELTSTAKQLNARCPWVRTSGTKAVILSSIKKHESRLLTQPKAPKTWDEVQASIFGKKKLNSVGWLSLCKKAHTCDRWSMCEYTPNPAEDWPMRQGVPWLSNGFRRKLQGHRRFIAQEGHHARKLQVFCLRAIVLGKGAWQDCIFEDTK